MKEKKMSQSDMDMPSNSSVRLTLWVAMIGLVIMTTWAGMTEIDQVKRAQGQVIASDRTQVIQAVGAARVAGARGRRGAGGSVVGQL
jgi:hypothetical protein